MFNEKFSGYFKWTNVKDFITNCQWFSVCHQGKYPKIIIGREVMLSELCKDAKFIEGNKFSVLFGLTVYVNEFEKGYFLEEYE